GMVVRDRGTNRDLHGLRRAATRQGAPCKLAIAGLEPRIDGRVDLNGHAGLLAATMPRLALGWLVSPRTAR
ncbi:MAG TPA: hypothetical protein VK601_08285, partial [Kofleriaceae bacterium]|nr:hypothetical protein [Kofleriaceae bacterium]